MPDDYIKPPGSEYAEAELQRLRDRFDEAAAVVLRGDVCSDFKVDDPFTLKTLEAAIVHSERQPMLSNDIKPPNFFKDAVVHIDFSKEKRRGLTLNQYFQEALLRSKKPPEGEQLDALSAFDDQFSYGWKGLMFVAITVIVLLLVLWGAL